MKNFVWRIRWCLSEIQTTLIWCVWGGGYMYVLSSNYAHLMCVWGGGYMYVLSSNYAHLVCVREEDTCTHCLQTTLIWCVCVRRRIHVRAVFKLRLYSEILSLEFRMPQNISRQWWGTHAIFRCTINIMPLYLIVDIYTSLCLTSFAKSQEEIEIAEAHAKQVRHTQNKTLYESQKLN